MTEHRTPPGPPPTVADLKAMGLTGADVTCTKCHRARLIVWGDIGLPDETPFPDVASLRRFVCATCGAREFTGTPESRIHVTGRG
jgi:hypothetical protein